MTSPAHDTGKTGASTLALCPYCGSSHSYYCPRIKVIEFHDNGHTKRVEFYGPWPANQQYIIPGLTGYTHNVPNTPPLGLPQGRAQAKIT